MQNVKTEAINYYGYLQGFKVFIDGQKYPKNKGEWYTTLNEKQAIKNALKEKAKQKYVIVFGDYQTETKHVFKTLKDARLKAIKLKAKFPFITNIKINLVK